jgi:rare lipoprotein A
MVPVKRGLVALLLVAACAHVSRGDGEESPHSRRGAGDEPLAEGMASYYGEAFRGHLTANGEKFDPDALTAAHRTLAFGTCVRVQSAETGRSIRVRVNDRGPYAKGRIIDLSEAAGRALDMIRSGVARVRLFRCW